MTIETKPMNVILYVRVSTREQVDNFSLETQEKICREYSERMGWNVVKVFREEGESAKTSDRTQLLSLLEYCRKYKGFVDVLLVYKFDRFARSTSDHHAVKAILLKSGVKVRSATEAIDDTPGGKLMETIFSGIAQFDNDVRSERTKEGMKEKLRQGQWAWKAPLGYKNSPTGLIVDNERAKYIKRAYEVYARGGLTIKALTNKINRWGLRTDKGKKISPQSVLKMLTNKLYTGTIEAWGEVHEGVHAPLISKSLFAKVNSIRLGKSSIANIPHFSSNSQFPLKNILICSGCLKRLTGSSSKGRTEKYAYYHCVCGSVRIRRETVENNFYKLLKEIQPDSDLLHLFKALLSSTWKKKHSEASKIVENIDKEISNYKILKQKLLQKNLDGVVSDIDYKEQVKICTEKIAIKEIERSEFREKESSADHLISLVETLFENVSSLWFEANHEDKQRFQRLIFTNGLLISNKGFGTTTLGLPFNLIGSNATNETTLVSQTGLEPDRPYNSHSASL